jgi:hypothetical protein
MGYQYEGVVDFVNHKDMNDRFKGGTVRLYSFRLQGVDQWFNCSSKAPNFGKGQTIKFNMKGKNVDMDSVVIVEDAPAAAAPAPAGVTTGTAGTSSAGISRDDYWANKEARDIERDERYKTVAEPRMALSVATECAAQVISAGLASDSIGFGNTAKSKRQDLLVEAVKHVALELAEFIHDAPNLLGQERGDSAGLFETEDE